MRNWIPSCCARSETEGAFAQPDGIYLDDHYHALADTEWIAKLYRAAIALHFRGRDGIADRTRPTVTVVPEELTDSVRRGFNLNDLVSLPPQRNVAGGKKKPGDRRHHVLEAMMINFLAGWTGDVVSAPVFPTEVHLRAHDFFVEEIAHVMPEQLAYEKPSLAEGIYGARRDNGETNRPAGCFARSRLQTDRSRKGNL